MGETEEDGGGLTTFGKKMSTTPGTGFQMVAPRAMEALQWPVKMLNGRMLNNPVPPPPPVASGVVKPPPPEEEDEALAVRETTANMATAAKRKRESDGPGILRFFYIFLAGRLNRESSLMLKRKKREIRVEISFPHCGSLSSR